MLCRIEYHRKIRKALRRLPLELSERIVEAVDDLKQDPFPEGKKIKRIKGPDETYRLRVGDYRVLYDVVGETITVTDIVHRRDLERALKRG